MTEDEHPRATEESRMTDRLPRAAATSVVVIDTSIRNVLAH
jgi:hypothetical protein